MKIAIYSEATRGLASVGGSELIVVTLAIVLRERGHEVEVIHHDSSITAHAMGARFSVSADALNLRFVEIEPDPASKNPWRRHLEEIGWYRQLTKGYDLFIEVAHHKPPVCRSGVGVLYVLFPFYDAATLWSAERDPDPHRNLLMKAYRRVYHRWNWRRIMRSYPMKAAISEFSRSWTKSRWGVDAEVIYPPSQAIAVAGEIPKHNAVLSVGRFAGKHVSKKQLELLDAFQQLIPEAPRDWRYQCVGGLGSAAEDQAYFARASSLARGLPIAVEANLSAEELQSRYRAAKIFWHATGFGEDEATRPEMSEHYGIATVEAMLAGCVPVVIKRGAQPEIVQHGVNGFLWETVDELKQYTMQLMRDDALRERLSDAARGRAGEFTRDKFVRRFLDFLKPALREP